MLLSNKKEQVIDTCSNVNKSQITALSERSPTLPPSYKPTRVTVSDSITKIS